MSRCALPLAAAMLLSLAPRAAVTQRAPTIVIPQANLEVRWSIPVEHVTRRVPSWSKTDLGLAGGFLALLWLDAAQTRSVASQGWGDLYETNPLLGPRPSVGQINTYTAAAAVTTLGIAALLPPRPRRWLLIGAMAVETYAITGNARAGVALKLH